VTRPPATASSSMSIMDMLLDAVAGGRVTRSALGDARVEKLKNAANDRIRTKAETTLGR